LLFWFFYPKWLQEIFYRRWRRKFPEWAQYIRETRGLSKRRMQELFPAAQIFVERTLGIPKSYSAWQKVDAERASRRAPHALGFSSAQKVSK
jgi:hypothetical protein